ncbi:MAG: hypothetical protein HEQ40_03600 [Lacibacter sp.]|jgi:hypothetical protein
MKFIKYLFILITISVYLNSYGQTQDTVLITPDNINISQLKIGTNRHLVYFKMSPGASRTNTQFWTRTTERSFDNGKPVFIVSQVWEDKDSIIHTTKSVADASTFQTISHESWWKQRGSSSFDFTKKEGYLNGAALSDADTSLQKKRVWEAYKKSWDVFTLNWHLDLEVFSLLPYKDKVTFLIPYYDPGSVAPQNVAYTVTGTAQLEGYDNRKIDCWLLVHEEKGNKEVFWISKKTNEVLKLEQEINGKMWRFKIKLSFSN